MSDKIYKFLLGLYPEHFRRNYGDEALRLVRDRARSEKGLWSGLRLWLDLLLDLAVSLPREYSNAPEMPRAAIPSVGGEPSFQLLCERQVSPTVLFLSGALSALLLCLCCTAVANSRTFPFLFASPYSLQGLVQSSLDLARRPAPELSVSSHVSGGAHSFCMTARRDISIGSAQPLLEYRFAATGASGDARIDGAVVKTFSNEQRLSIRANVSAGDHEFVLRLDRPAEITLISGDDDFGYCEGR